MGIFEQTREVSRAVSTLNSLIRQIISSMLHNYNRYIELGYAPIFAKENFENMYQQYHELGVNGVMTQLHAEFMELPTESEENHHG